MTFRVLLCCVVAHHFKFCLFRFVGRKRDIVRSTSLNIPHENNGNVLDDFGGGGVGDSGGVVNASTLDDDILLAAEKYCENRNGKQ